MEPVPEVRKGDYVFATKWSDGHPQDHWCLGFYDRTEGDRHYVVDSNGNQFRGNGFRRVAKIRNDVGTWLLSVAGGLEDAPAGTVNLWGMLTDKAFELEDEEP